MGTRSFVEKAQSVILSFGEIEVKRRQKRFQLVIVCVVCLFAVAVLVTWIFGARHGSLDFSPPAGDAVDVVAIQGECLAPDVFVENIRDNKDSVNDIKITFSNAPDMSVPGSHTFPVFLTDKNGNKRALYAHLTVLPGTLRLEADTFPKTLTAADFVPGAENVSIHSTGAAPIFNADAARYEYSYVITVPGEREIPCTFALRDVTPPVISGVHDFNVPLGDTILYREGVSVTDDLDSDVRLEIDSAAVDLSEPGSYPVTYKAVDAGGNETVETAQVTVISAEQALVFERADEILAGIFTTEMTLRDKAYAIYRWVKSNMRYTAAEHTEDTIQGAYTGLTRGAGDCFTFYAVSEILLTRAGIENLHIKRIPEANVDHNWNLVNLGEGWYHFDTCPPFVKFNGFMFTESQARVYSKMQLPIREHYFDYVHEDYPPVTP